MVLTNNDPGMKHRRSTLNPTCFFISANTFLSCIDSSSEISSAICKTQIGEVDVGKFRLLLEADDFKVVSHSFYNAVLKYV